MRSRIAVAAALGATLALTLSACATHGSPTAGGATASPPAATPSSPPSPAEVLAAAVTRTTGVSLKVKMAGDAETADFTGSYDAVHQIGAVGQAGGMQVTVAGDDLYIGGLSDLAGKTARFKISKIRVTSPVNMFADLVPPLDLLTAATEVESTDTNKFIGHLDLTRARAANPGAKRMLAYMTSVAGAKANSIPFTATIDDAGYLIEFAATFPDGTTGSQEFDIRFSEIGRPVTNTVPTGPNMIDAPAAAYDAM
jgi:hypothetical protein